MITARGTDSAELKTVIVTKSLKGSGTDDDPCRIVTQYCDLNGELLAERDYADEKK